MLGIVESESHATEKVCKLSISGPFVITLLSITVQLLHNTPTDRMMPQQRSLDPYVRKSFQVGDRLERVAYRVSLISLATLVTPLLGAQRS